MEVRKLCATALGNRVALQPWYYCSKQFMVMTQEEIIDTYASGTHIGTFMHIQRRYFSLSHTYCSAAYVTVWGDANPRRTGTETLMTFPNKSKMALVHDCKCEWWLIWFQRVGAVTDESVLWVPVLPDCVQTCIQASISFTRLFQIVKITRSVFD